MFEQEFRSFDFRPDISVGHQWDSLIVPNVPFLTAAWKLLRADLLEDFAVKTVILSTNSKPFVVSDTKLMIFQFDELK